MTIESPPPPPTDDDRVARAADRQEREHVVAGLRRELGLAGHVAGHEGALDDHRGLRRVREHLRHRGRNFFIGIPKDILESARIDGASERRIFFPLGLPAIASLAILHERGTTSWSR